MKRLGPWFVLATLALTAGSALAGSSDNALKTIVDDAKAAQSDTLLVMHDGKTLVDYRRPGAPAGPIEMMSSTKSLIGLAVGRLVTQGKLKSIDEPVSDFYPEWKQGNKAKITVRMLLNHTSGMQNVPMAPVEIYPAPDAYQLALAAELSDPPGTKFSYNNKAMNLIGGVIEKASGKPMDVYIADELLTPMGIKAAPWNPENRDKAGHPMAMAGWMSTAQDAAKIGQLVLDNGRWQGKQLIDADYIKQMVGQSTPLTTGYGLLWWRRGDGIRFNSAVVERVRAGGNTALADKLARVAAKVYPTARDVVAAITAEGVSRADMHDMMKSNHLVDDDLFASTPIVAWEANGYLGNYIVIVPKAHLVAVRQIAERKDADEDHWPYGYAKFSADVIGLGRTYAKDLAVDTP